ncbi:MAG TPA: hypothetical protein DCM05_02695 [Elusimicrobia bacterium]|nr:hypothetical protein [Elusimicrobiota bacterium]
MNRVRLLDCTIRDGGYLNDWRFDERMVRDVYRASSKAGVDVVELGFRGTERCFDPAQFGPWRFTPESLLREAVRGGGARVALMADFGKIEADDFCDRKDSVVDMVRVAAHRDAIPGALALLEKIKKKGYTAVLNVMGFTSMSEAERAELRNLARGSAVDILYVADSYGSMFPDQIRGIFEPLLEIGGPLEIGFHPHNNLQMAFANTLEALRVGVHYLDATQFGMGRGAGNLPLETLLAYLQQSRKDKYNVIPVLNCIDRHLIALNRQLGWGHQLPYMLSGIFQCHPYYAQDLVELHEYAIEDVWKALERVRLASPVGYDRKLLSEIVGSGLLGPLPTTEAAGDAWAQEAAAQEPPAYAGRHEGRDFLVLAGGPSLIEYKDQVQEFIRRRDPILLGANNLGGHFVPHYHAFINKKRFMSYAAQAHRDSKLLVGQYLDDDMVREYSGREVERLRYADRLSSDFRIVNGVIGTNGRTIGVLLCAVAIVMGAKRVFVAGMDGYAHLPEGRGTLFYAEKDEPESREEILDRHRWCQRILASISDHLTASGREELHILTPTSYQQFYKGLQNYLDVPGLEARP